MSYRGRRRRRAGAGFNLLRFDQGVLFHTQLRHAGGCDNAFAVFENYFVLCRHCVEGESRLGLRREA